MFDPDGDLVKCRWARGKECDSVCKAVPVADLDEVGFVDNWIQELRMHIYMIDSNHSPL